jgi:hypothetical protein
MPRSFNGERIVLSINGAGPTGYPHAKKESRTHITCHIQKSTQKETKI